MKILSNLNQGISDEKICNLCYTHAIFVIFAPNETVLNSETFIQWVIAGILTSTGRKKFPKIG